MTYQSPFSNRYGSKEMRALWSERAKRLTWRRVWVAVAEAQFKADLVSAEQIKDLKQHANQIDLQRAQEIEAEIRHDLMAELKTFAEQCPIGGAILHWGMTSADVQDNADILRQKAALTLLLKTMQQVLIAFAQRIQETADVPVMGYTHLQPAEPTSLGYRLSQYAQDIEADYIALARIRRELRGKGIRGAVGSAAPFTEMLEGHATKANELEADAMAALGLTAFPISTQTYPRTQDLRVLQALAGLAASLHKFAFDMRLLQSPGFRAAAEPFGKQQVGSSAMPFKRNPVQAENICSLAREVLGFTTVAWQNAANQLLERTLDDSANRRSILPEAFLACDAMLGSSLHIVQGMLIDEAASKAALELYGPFSATERVLSALVRAGADRGTMHERLRLHSLNAWESIQTGRENPLQEVLSQDTTLLRYLQPAQIRELLDVSSYQGLAPQRAKEFAVNILARFQPPDDGQIEAPEDEKPEF